MYRKPAPPCADAPGNAVQFIFLFNFCSISLLHLFSKMFLFGERAQLQSPRCSAILPPTEPACNTHPPPIFSWIAKCPCARRGSAGKHACAQTSLCVSVVRDTEGDGHVTPSHMRVCAPGLRSWVRVFTHSYPGGGAGGYPPGQKTVEACEGPGRGNTLPGNLRVSVRSGNTCARVGLGPDDPYSHHPSELSSGV